MMMDKVRSFFDTSAWMPECRPSGAPESPFAVRNQGLTPLAIGVAPLRGSPATRASWIPIYTAALLFLSALPATAAETPAAPADYTHTIRPLLAKYCADCHGPQTETRFQVGTLDEPKR